MTLACVHARASGRVPAEVVASRTALVALERGGRVDERVVVEPHVRRVEHADPLVTPHEYVPGDDGSARDLEEEAVLSVFDPVVHEHGIAVPHVVPDAVRIRIVYDEVVAARDSPRLIEDLDGGRVIASEPLDVVPADDVPFEQDVRGPDDVDALRARIADERVADDEPIPTEVSGYSRTEGDRDVLEHCADDFLAERGRIRWAHRFVGRLIGRRELLLAFDFERPVGVLRKSEAADDRALAIRRLAVHRQAGADQRAVECRDFDLPRRGIDADVDLPLVVVDVVRVLVHLAFPPGRLQHPAVYEDHVVIEAVHRRPHALAVALPPAKWPGGEQTCPRRLPEFVPQRLPVGGDLSAFENGTLVAIGLERDALVQEEPAGAVDAASQDDGVTRHDPGHGRFQRGRLRHRAWCIGPPVGRDVIDVRRRGTS